MSPQKTAVRARSYGAISRRHFYGKIHIVIASRECGDIRFLIAHGVQPDKIVACDLDPAAIAAARKLGVTLSPHGDIRETVAWAFQKYGKKNIASINVDLCCGLWDGTPILRGVLDLGITKNIQVFFTYRRGRRDGFRNDYEREAHLRTHIQTVKFKRPLVMLMPYHSWHSKSTGSAMGVAIF
jgi:hypothetical protein